jgi:hypothetical protein
MSEKLDPDGVAENMFPSLSTTLMHVVPARPVRRANRVRRGRRPGRRRRIVFEGIGIDRVAAPFENPHPRHCGERVAGRDDRLGAADGRPIAVSDGTNLVRLSAALTGHDLPLNGTGLGDGKRRSDGERDHAQHHDSPPCLPPCAGGRRV